MSKYFSLLLTALLIAGCGTINKFTSPAQQNPVRSRQLKSNFEKIKNITSRDGFDLARYGIDYEFYETLANNICDHDKIPSWQTTIWIQNFIDNDIDNSDIIKSGFLNIIEITCGYSQKSRTIKGLRKLTQIRRASPTIQAEKESEALSVFSQLYNDSNSF